MTLPCPAEDTILLDQLGELKVHESRALAEHERACRACQRRRAEVAALLADLDQAARALPDDGVAFCARVQARMDPRVPVIPLRTRLGLPAGWRAPVFAAAAALLVAPVAVLLHGRTREAAVPERLTARGHTTPAAPAAELLLVRAGRMVEPSGRTLRPSDALAVRVVNGGPRTVYLMAFALDSACEVHWFYPEYRDPGADPTAVAIEPASPWQVLPELVSPDQAPEGPLRLVTALFRAPTTVKQIERRLTSAPAGAPLGTRLPEATVREWSARWEGGTGEVSDNVRREGKAP